MNLAKRCVVVFAAFVTLLFTASAHADSFQLTYSGANISGNLSLTATANGGGVYTVTSITGSQVLDGITQAVTGIVPAPTNPSTYIYPDTSYATYNNLVYTAGSPVDIYGLLFGVVGESQPVNLCSACGFPGESYTEFVYLGSGGNYSSIFQDYAITSMSIQTPEPSTILLLALGVAALLVGRKRFAGLEI